MVFFGGAATALVNGDGEGAEGEGEDQGGGGGNERGRGRTRGKTSGGESLQIGRAHV